MNSISNRSFKGPLKKKDPFQVMHVPYGIVERDESAMDKKIASFGMTLLLTAVVACNCNGVVSVVSGICLYPLLLKFSSSRFFELVHVGIQDNCVIDYN